MTVDNSGVRVSAGEQHPRRIQQAAFAAGVGLLATVLKWWAVRTGVNSHSDFDELWIGARALMHGESPYAAVLQRIGRWPLYYPIHAVAAQVPLAALPFSVARVAYTGISAFAFTLAVTWNGWGRWPALLSGPFISAAGNGQWSPILVAATVFPALSFLLVSKPTTGGALLLAEAPRLIRRRAFWVGLSIAAALAIWGTVVDPHWITEWLAVTRNTPQVKAPAAYVPWLGFPIVAASLLRWRRPEARIVAFLALMPQSFRLYELLPLFLVPVTQRQTLFLALSSWVAELSVGLVNEFSTAIAYQERHAVWYLALVYLPCVAMVLARRNEGQIPARLERFIAGWPRALRGQPT